MAVITVSESCGGEPFHPFTFFLLRLLFCAQNPGHTHHSCVNIRTSVYYVAVPVSRVNRAEAIFFFFKVHSSETTTRFRDVFRKGTLKQAAFSLPLSLVLLSEARNICVQTPTTVRRPFSSVQSTEHSRSTRAHTRLLVFLYRSLKEGKGGGRL